MGAHKHAAAVMRVYRDRHRDKTTFCVLSCETPQEYSLTGSRDPGTVGVSCLCLAHILFIILFCNGGRKFAQARDFSPLIISTLARRVGGRRRWGEPQCKNSQKCFSLVSDLFHLQSLQTLPPWD